MDCDLFLDMLRMDSTSSSERDLALYLSRRLPDGRSAVELHEVGDGTLNVFLRWGRPGIVFCTHLDTVPPYIAPSVTETDDGRVRFSGRGTCDAKGQIISMYSACRSLSDEGHEGFGLLLLAGEETGSWGAKSAASDIEGSEYLVVGEPTGNMPVRAAKGTKSFDVTVRGVPFHSGYPENGRSAVESFVSFMNGLQGYDFAVDSVLGKTTFNVGMLESMNPQNILSPEVRFRIYFRTTFVSDDAVCSYMSGLDPDIFTVKSRGGDAPSEYFVPEGFASTAVAFGSDAPHLKQFGQRMICGPGSILTAHTDGEHVYLDELEDAVEVYRRMFYRLVLGKDRY